MRMTTGAEPTRGVGEGLKGWWDESLERWGVISATLSPFPAFDEVSPYQGWLT
jgi:hypothetical protein